MIQIDMQMPEACDVCPFNYDFCWCNAFWNHDEEWEKYSDDWNDHVCDRETRPEYCPLKEIVRCKDCRWGDPSYNAKGEDMVFCYNGDTGIEDGYLHEPNWFCAEGERRTE